jgi:superfamily I DNA and/or RNA helicase
LQDERRVSVALRRARSKLVLLDNARELRADPWYGLLLDAVAPPSRVTCAQRR